MTTTGADRYVTSAWLSADTFTAADVVYITTGAQYADALAGAPLASRTSSPILLVRTDRVDASVCDEIKRLRPSKVVALGGDASVSEATLNAAVACAAPAAPQSPAPAPARPRRPARATEPTRWTGARHVLRSNACSA